MKAPRETWGLFLCLICQLADGAFFYVHPAWENTRKNHWHTAKSLILSTSINTARLRLAGYVFFTDYYIKLRVVS